MAKLKAGTYDDFTSSLAEEMDEALKDVWSEVKGTALPGGAVAEDRKLLFIAISRGLLKFLKEHDNDIVTNEEDAVREGDPDYEHDHYVKWDYY